MTSPLQLEATGFAGSPTLAMPDTRPAWCVWAEIRLRESARPPAPGLRPGHDRNFAKRGITACMN